MTEKTLEQMIEDHKAAVAAASQWVEHERALRKAIFDKAFPDAKPGEKQKKRLADGMALLGELPINYNVDRAALTAITPAEGEELENFRVLADSIISWSPKVKEGAFKKLGPNEVKIFANVITEKPAGTVSIEVKPASSVKW